MTAVDLKSLRAMRRFATALLLAMVGLYLVARAQVDVHPAWGFVRAFAEAAMVGGLADWFAVTALFRHPLGVPIPHTAIIPKSQGRIADALGAFISENFLAPDLVAERLKSQDLAAGIGKTLAEPANARRLADGLVSALPMLLATVDDAVVAAFLRRQAEERARAAKVSPAAGRLLKFLTDEGRHQPLVDALLKEGWRALEENEPTLRAHVRQRSGWLMRLLTVDERAANALVAGIEDTLRDVAADRDHPIRRQATEALHKFADDLQRDPVLQARVEAIKDEMIAHPAMAAYVGDLWAAAKAHLREEAAAPDSRLREGLSELLLGVGRGLGEEAGVRDALNERLRALIVDLAGRHRGDVARLVSETIRGWDASTVVEKLEQNVGRDLQYIRVSGTLIGGCVGVVIHAIGMAFD